MKKEFKNCFKLKNSLKITLFCGRRGRGKNQEGEKIRTQPFEGIVIAIKGRGENKMFTVRKIGADAIGVERIWPDNSPWIEKVVVKKQGRVRRAKLYYLRKRVGKKAKKVKQKRKTEGKPAVKRKNGKKKTLPA